MREMTFTRFLEGYVRGLSSTQPGVHVRRMSREVEAGNLRLLEPLMVLAFLTDRLHLVEKEATPAGPLSRELDRLRSFNGHQDLLDTLVRPDWSGGGRLPVEYYKVWEAFSARRQLHDDTDAKEALRQRALERQAASGTTTYRAAADLGLNEGALWDFLSRGNLAALTRDDARRVAEYMGLGG